MHHGERAERTIKPVHVHLVQKGHLDFLWWTDQRNMGVEPVTNSVLSILSTPGRRIPHKLTKKLRDDST